MLTVTVPPELAAPLAAEAGRRGTTPELLALEGIRRVLPAAAPTPTDEWERRLLAAATDCGVSISDEGLSSDGLYD